MLFAFHMSNLSLKLVSIVGAEFIWGVKSY